MKEWDEFSKQNPWSWKTELQNELVIRDMFYRITNRSNNTMTGYCRITYCHNYIEYLRLYTVGIIIYYNLGPHLY